MNLENFQTTNLGDIVYHSDSSGKFMLHEISTINKFGIDTLSSSITIVQLLLKLLKIVTFQM